jgi:hypothetical protein
LQPSILAATPKKAGSQAAGSQEHFATIKSDRMKSDLQINRYFHPLEKEGKI